MVVLKDAPSMNSFVDQHLLNIVKTIAQEKDFDLECEPKYQEVIPFAMQYKESSFDFLNRLSAIYNELFFYDGRNMVFGTPENQAIEKLIFKEDISYLRTISKTLPYQHSLYGYQPQEDQYFFSEKDVPITFENKVIHSLLESPYLYGYRGILPVYEATESNSQVQEFRQGKYQATLGKMHFIEGESDTCKVRIGGLIQIGYPEKFGIDNSLGIYRVISVQHKVERGSYSNTFTAVPQGMEYALFEPKTIAYPETAEVIANNDPKGQGRVKVRFYWQKAKGLETNWIRVQSPDAGVFSDKKGNRGVVFVPEIGDQVMVGFEHGNPHLPYVSGSFFHGKNATNLSNNVRSITTKSGHQLVFTDEESIVLSDKNGNTIQINSVENTIEITAVEQLKFKSKQMTFQTTQDIEIIVGGNKKETIKKQSESISDRSILTTHNTLELQSASRAIFLSKEMDILTRGSDIRIKAGNTAYIQGRQSVEIDQNSGSASPSVASSLREDVGQGEQGENATKITEMYYTDLEGNRIKQDKFKPETFIYLNVKGENLAGKSGDLELSNAKVDFEHKGVYLENDILKNYTLESDYNKIELKVIKPKND